MVVRRLGTTAIVALCLAGCRGKDQAPTPEGVVALSSPTPDAQLDPSMEPKPGGPKLAAVHMAAPIFDKPDRRSAKVGYLRAGGTLVRGEKPVMLDDCQGGWFRVLPVGYVCASHEATTDLNHPIVRALSKRPDLSKPMPYPYAFVRAIAPNYFRPPSKNEQFQYEMSLKEHLASYGRKHKEWDEVRVGANDVPLDAEGNAIGVPPEEPPVMDYNALYGGDGDDKIPWFFQGSRKIPNISTFKVPDFAVMTNRIARKAGLALIGTFVGDNERRLALTTDARLVPTSKLKPARGSTWHGVDMSKGWELPLGFVHKRGASHYEISDKKLAKAGELDWHSTVQLTGRATRVAGARYVETKNKTWINDDHLAIAVKPSEQPFFARGSRKWIDISILGQTLVLYEGRKPIYATMVATGRDGLGDPKKTFSTVRGTFRIRDKHVTATMDAHEVDNKFELRDVPWVQYFEHGYALHAAPWHDEYGKPRSHGCINLSPIDARRVFLWSDPPLPADWHGVNSSEKTGEGTLVHIHP
jgi:lipoprotein-anchoring transpeptidase ErfK/SrfK